MLTVTGVFDDGAAYRVQITGRADRPVIGSRRAAALIELHMGERIALSPAGPMKVVSGDDTKAVLEVLRRSTNVINSMGAAAP
ncbi:hypothetical protein HHL19_35445 [Streptomyces sp. R302]|uniref:hypothetical protein n=1 Tax=unclassified Streptomyces TaxID=2593676 RepID=UPI00145CE96F|nr:MULTISPECIES: hypothetical protein [unclassified Streptomyces]NML55163.1 hypothetical protein [Streptomyces sp. R301]NML83807.1 hypothetical protein [Streptomyces sp. R302]